MMSRVQFVLSLMLLILYYVSIDGFIISTNLYMWQARSFFSGDGRILQRLHPINYWTERQEYHHQQQSLFGTGIDSTNNYNDDEDEKKKYTMVEDDDHQRHVHFMTMALKEAERAKQAGEVPIGAVVVQRTKDEVDDPNGIVNIKNAKIHIFNTSYVSNSFDTPSSFRVLSRAGNSVERNFDASAHAELLALRDAARVLKNWRLQDCVLYSTLEPCPMCLAAAQAFRVEQIVYGAPDMRLGAHMTFMKLLDDYQHPYHTIRSIVPGVLDDESSGMLRDFFRSRRKEQKQKQLLQKTNNNFEDEEEEEITTSTTRQRSKRSIVMKYLRDLPLSLWKRVKTRIIKTIKIR